MIYKCRTFAVESLYYINILTSVTMRVFIKWFLTSVLFTIWLVAISAADTKFSGWNQVAYIIVCIALITAISVITNTK